MILLLLLAAYILGSIPFGLLLTRAVGLGDIRQIGSGNIGATNVLRTGNKPIALATLLLDGAKGAIAVALGMLLTGEHPIAVAMGVVAVLGHTFSIFLKFRGGKGVATGLGFFLAAYFPLGLAACGTWLVVALLTRYSSLAALVAFGLAPIYAKLFEMRSTLLAALVLALLVAWNHRANIRRLLDGTEPKIGVKKTTLSSAPDAPAPPAL